MLERIVDVRTRYRVVLVTQGRESTQDRTADGETTYKSTFEDVKSQSILTRESGRV